MFTHDYSILDDVMTDYTILDDVITVVRLCPDAQKPAKARTLLSFGVGSQPPPRLLRQL